MKLRAKFNKKNYLKYISHLDIMRLFERAFQRAGIPMEFSQGFNQRPKFSIASPLTLGIESDEEYMDLELTMDMEGEILKEKLNAVLPKDIQILEVRESQDKKTVASLITWARYNFKIIQEEAIDTEKLKKSLENWINRDEIIIEKEKKKKRQKWMALENIRESIGEFKILNIQEDFLEVEALIKTGSVENLRPFDFIQALMRDNYLQGEMDLVHAKRVELLIGDKKEVFKSKEILIEN